jgi:peptidoglycan/xylan/chitin deacetylase (PgdA/CDA1 family)
MVDLAGSRHPGAGCGCRNPWNLAGDVMINLGRNRRTDASMSRLGLGRLPMILMYHSVADVFDDPGQLSVAPSRFAEQMAVLQRLGLRGVSMCSLVDAMRAGRERGLVGITFDDGYVNILEAALPELKRRGFTATVFVIAGRLGGTNEWAKGPSFPLLSDSQVRELADAGIEIGSHSMTHVRLAGLAASQVQAEISESRAILGELLGAPVRGFAYPYGSMDAAARRVVEDVGYDYACAVETPRAEFGIMALPRVYVGQRDRATRMTAKRLLYRGYIAVEARRAERSSAI